MVIGLHLQHPNNEKYGTGDNSETGNYGLQRTKPNLKNLMMVMMMSQQLLDDNA